MNFPIAVTGKAWQRKIRESRAALPDPLLTEKQALASSLSNATVTEIDYKTAKEVIKQYEWLGNMGTTDFSFGLYFGEHLAGVVCFGRTAGTKTAASVCGPEYEHMVKTLCRGACVHWAHPHSASYLISKACRLMSEQGFHIFVAYSDAEAGEVGTVYQACNWLHCEPTKQGSSMFVWSGKRDGGFKDGKLRDERCIQHSTRIRRCEGQSIAPYRIKCTRRELREQMVKEGFLFFKSTPKRRYVTFVGDKRLERELRAALRWNVLPYPKRTICGGSVQGEQPDTIGKGVVRIHTTAPISEVEPVKEPDPTPVPEVKTERTPETEPAPVPESASPGLFIIKKHSLHNGRTGKLIPLKTPRYFQGEHLDDKWKFEWRMVTDKTQAHLFTTREEAQDIIKVLGCSCTVGRRAMWSVQLAIEPEPTPDPAPVETANGATCSDQTIFRATGLKQAIRISRDGTLSEVHLPVEGCAMNYKYRRGTTLADLRKEAEAKFKEWATAKAGE